MATTPEAPHTVLVTGGAGYVGSALVPRLLEAGYAVTVLDRYWYGDDVLQSCRQHPGLTELRGDIRDAGTLQRALNGVNSVIHLACISNDPSYDLTPELGKSINYDAFRPLVRAARARGVGRFIYASSSSVYGVKSEPEVTEELALEPLTDYSKYKALCEDILFEERAPGFVPVVVRPSTVCGYATRLRLDLVANILTNQAYHQRSINVMGGAQMRPNIHIQDMVDAYLCLLRAPADKVDAQIFNVGDENHTVSELAQIVVNTVGSDVEVTVTPSNDNRSYHVCSKKIREQLGFFCRRGVAQAVAELRDAFASGKVERPLDNPLYFNIRRMRQLGQE